MLRYPKILVYCVLILFLEFNNAEISVTVAPDASFRLQIFPKTLDNPTICTLTSPKSVTTNIPLDYTSDNSQTAAEDERIVPLGNNQCGARIHHTNNSDVGKWTLTISNADDESLTEIFRVKTVFWETPVNTSSTAVIGDLGIIVNCGPSNILYCELRNPLGNLATLTSKTRCQTILDGVKATDFGIWSCTVGLSGSTSEIHGTHTLEIGDPSEEVVIFSNDTSLGTLISWQVYRIIPSASWCRAFPPNGQTILVSAGLEVEKYVSAGTDLANNKCGLLINGELSEEYVGTWRLEMGLTSGRIIGGFIKMPEGETPGVDDGTIEDDSESLSKRIMEINVAVGKPFAITCQTNYSAGYCWIKGPKGQRITSTEGLSVGKCSHNIDESVLNDHDGNWTCNMAHIDGGKEEHFITKVNVIDRLYRSVNPELAVARGDRTVIACKSVLDCPLQYCRFVRPDGTGIGVKPGMESSDRYSYQGLGLDRGYCGIAISSVESVDFGEWTCVSRSTFRTWEGENWDTIIIREPDQTSTASVIGLTFGALLFVGIGTGALLIRNRRKRLENPEESMIVVYNQN